MENSFDFGRVFKNHEKIHKSKPTQFVSVAGGVKKRLETISKFRKSSRLSVFDRIRNLPRSESPVAVPEPKSKVEHRREQLEKWKEEKEKRKKELAAQKKKPFLTGVPHASLKFVPPPPPPKKPVPCTSGRVTRSQSARIAKQKTKEPVAEPVKSFAPKNASFKPPSILNSQKLPSLKPPMSKKEKKAPFKFEPIITNTKPTQSSTNYKNTDSKGTQRNDNKNKGKTGKATTKTSTKNLKSSSSSEVDHSPVRKTSAKTKNVTKQSTSNKKSLSQKQTKQTTPKSMVPKSESSSEERLRPSKSPVESMMSPEQIVEEAKKMSPCVTISRGKANARREMKKKLDDGLLDEDASNMDSVDYFRKQLASEIKRMTEMCDTWDRILEQTVLPDAVQECVLGAVGQARLLMSAKLAQFAALVERCARPEPAAPLVTPADLHGFWDMVFMQVENVDIRFKKLDELRARGWVEEQVVVVKPKVVKPMKAGVKPVKPSGGNSRLKEMIAAARKAKKEQNNPEPLEEKTFEAGFFSVRSPVRASPTPHTPQHKNSLLKAVLSSEAKKSASKNAPFAMLRASLHCRNLECEGFAPLPVTPKSDMNLATPGRSILKQKTDTGNKSAKKSIKVVLFDEFEQDINKSVDEQPATDSGISSMDVEKEQKENSRRKSNLVRQDATEERSPVLTRSRRRSLKTPQGKEDKTPKKSGVLEELENNSNIIEKETPKRSTRRRKSAAVEKITG